MLLTVFLIGAAGGLLSGMLGVGGAVILLPLLTTVAGLSLKDASGITIVQVLVAALISVVVYYRGRLVHLPLAIHMGAASALGGLAGGYGSQAVPSYMLEWLFLVVVVVALALLFIPVTELTPVGGKLPRFNRAQAVGLGVTVGALAGLLGAGGGFLIVPLMIGALRLPTRLAIGSSPVVILLSAAFGLAGKVMAGQITLLPALALVGGAAPSAYLGARLGRRLPARSLRVLLGAVLFVIALRGVLLLLGLLR